MERNQVKAGVMQISPVAPILFAIQTSGLIKWVQEYVVAEGLPYIYHLGRVETGHDVSQVVTTVERCAAKGIVWTNSCRLQFDTGKTDVTLFMLTRDLAQWLP